MKEKQTRQKRDLVVHVRLSPDEMARVRLLMENSGHTAVSCFMRDLITLKRLPERRREETVDAHVLAEKVNLLVYQVNKIGVNYNQVVATLKRQSRRVGPDGRPYLREKGVELALTSLMKMTEGLRDEFAVVLDVVKRYMEGASPE